MVNEELVILKERGRVAADKPEMENSMEMTLIKL